MDSNALRQQVLTCSSDLANSLVNDPTDETIPIANMFNITMIMQCTNGNLFDATKLVLLYVTNTAETVHKLRSEQGLIQNN